MNGHYDKNTDIAWLLFDGWDAERVEVEEAEHGLIERDRVSGRVVGLEFWNAKEQLPKVLLDALPRPPQPRLGVRRDHD